MKIGVIDFINIVQKAYLLVYPYPSIPYLLLREMPLNGHLLIFTS
ncbi:hypothetical protein JOD15_001185 [Enterococcus ureilyticus]|nr:hypothetical protein [Enterococcus ureilyticus]